MQTPSKVTVPVNASRIAFNSSDMKESQDLKYRDRTRDEKRNGVKS